MRTRLEMALTAFAMGHTDGAEAAFREILAQQGDTMHPQGRGECLEGLGDVARGRGDAAAVRQYQEAIEAYRRAGLVAAAAAVEGKLATRKDGGNDGI
jgi:tetratricopeptide (TPR) repeat protein